MNRSIFSEPTVTYCEPIRDELVKRPYYALSNLPFLISGVYILFHGKGSKLSKQFGYIAILIGLLSSIYDSTYIYLSQIFDLVGMLLFVNLLIFLNLKKFSHAKKLLLLQSALTILGVVLIVAFQGYMGNIVFGAFVIVAVISELYLARKGFRTQFKRWLFAFLLFLVGFLFWILDTNEIYCTDFGLLNGRAIFHYTSSIVIFMLYHYYSLQD